LAAYPLLTILAKGDKVNPSVLDEVPNVILTI
jgi:hypothetical protein